TVNDVDQNIVVNEILPSAGGSITINELESIALSIDAYDPDGNPLVYNWQLDGTQVSTTDSYNFTTDYSSAGSYIVTLGVTDNYSDNSINYTWNITVNETDQNIIITEILPSTGGSLTINELESIAFSIDAYDPDGNPLEYNWELDGTQVSTTDSYNFTTDYTSAGSYIVSLDITDNFTENTINYTWNITVNDVDQNIVVNEILPSAGGSITIDELESIAFSIDAYDPDGNPLEYNWELDGTQVSINASYTYISDYTSAGSHLITLLVTDSFSDNSLNYSWDITVNDVDQYIVVDDIQPAPGEIAIDEMETINFFIDAYDPDGNTLEYSWNLDGTQVSTTDSYDFTTDYTSAGIYSVTLAVADNFSDNSLNYIWDITVNDVDQNIVINEILPSAGGNITIEELESIAFSIDAHDPDGNPLEYNWELDGTQVSTTDSYNFTTDYSSAGSYIVTLEVTDNYSDNTINYTWDIIVNDVDQYIIINEILPSAGGSITINELESISFSIDAYDPDGNPLEYNWELDGAIVSNQDYYQYISNYNSAGLHTISLEITDNFASDNTLIYTWNITVTDVDRPIIVNELIPEPGSITMNEGETIDFSIDALDPDGNPLEYSWQLDGTEVSNTIGYSFITDFNSAGSYNVTLNVTDNFLTDNTINYSWEIVVEDVDQEIVVDEILPEPGNLFIQESESINFSIDAYDPDGNVLEYNWELDGTTVSTTDAYEFTTDMNSAGIYFMELFVTDNYSDNALQFDWNITVLDGGSNIIITNIDPAPGALEIFENDNINFLIEAYAFNGDDLTYDWQLDGSTVSSTNTYLFTSDFTSAGEYQLSLEVEDEQSADTILNFIWNIIVFDSDQQIVVNDIQPVPGSVTISETETIDFFIDAYDPDGNPLEYSWKLDGEEMSTVNTYEFITDLNSAGLYLVTLDVTDNFGENTLYYEWNVTVLETDQSIVINSIQPEPGDVTTLEGEVLEFYIDAYDPDGNELEYNWELDGAQVSTSAAYNFLPDYNAAGMYAVTLNVTDNFLADNSVDFSWNVTVIDVDQEIVVIELIPAQTTVAINEGESIDFSISAIDPDGNDLTYSWDLDGTQVSTTDSYEFVAATGSAGSYVLTLIVDDNYSDSSLEFVWDITVLDPSINIIINEISPAPGNLTISETEIIEFFIDAYSQNGDDLSYSWMLDGTAVSTENTYEFTTDFSSTGEYVITVQITDTLPPETTLEFTWNITVTDTDQLIVVNSIEPEPGLVTMLEMETLYLSIDAVDPDGNELEYLWELDGEGVSTTNTYNFSPDCNASGEYLITLSLTDNYSDNSLEFEWNVIVEDINPNINIDSIQPPPGEFCITIGDSVNFFITADNPYGDIYYSWVLDGEEVATVYEYLFNTDEHPVGDYYLQLIISTDAITRETLHFDWGVSVIYIDQSPIADAGDDQYVDSGVQVQLDGSGSYDPEGEDLTYHWIVPEDIILSDSTVVNPTFIAPDVTGEVDYFIQLIVNDGENSSEPDEVIITVNGDSNTDPGVLPQVTELRSNYPNPFNPITTIKFDVQDNETARLTIFNLKGQVVRTETFTSGTHNYVWNAQNVSSGVYFYQLKSSTYTNTKKMILLK
ncbi:MAG: PKD domain-containing protein, partial [Candidatus Tenebribacter davisii]|nr:PKD domain-containing protein [Candidatus Tenebribacter davisii]